MIMRLPASHAAADSSPRADVHGTGRAAAPGFEAALGAAGGKPTVEATSPDLADADTFGTNLAGAGAPAQTPPEAPTPSLAPEALRRPAGSVPAPLPPDPAASSPAGAAAPLPPPPAPSPVVSPVRPERAVSPSDARPDDHARGAAGQQSGAEQHVASDPRMRGALVDNRAAAARALSGSDLAAQAPDDGTVGGMSTAADRRPLSWLNRHRGTSELSADGRINLKAGTSGGIAIDAAPSGAASRLWRMAEDAPSHDRWPKQQQASGLPEAARNRPSVDMKPLVIRRETHFAPVAPREPLVTTTMLTPSPAGTAPIPAASSAGSTLTAATASAAQPPRSDVSTVVGQIAQALAGRPDAAALPPADPAPAAPQPASAPAPQAAGSALRIIEIQLQPATLGALTVTMRMSSIGLKVTVSATSRETAQLLQESRSELAELMRRAGHAAADVAVEHAAGADPDAGGSGAESNGGSPRDRQQPRSHSPAQPPRLPVSESDPRLQRSITV